MDTAEKLIAFMEHVAHPKAGGTFDPSAAVLEIRQ
jgi:hypothetical protein